MRYIDALNGKIFIRFEICANWEKKNFFFQLKGNFHFSQLFFFSVISGFNKKKKQRNLSYKISCFLSILFVLAYQTSN